MSGRSSPAGDAGGGESGSLRLTVRKDLFPEPGPESSSPRPTVVEDISTVSCVNLETDFEQSIDEIALAKRIVPNGLPERKHRSAKKRKRKRRSSSPEEKSDDSDGQLENGLSIDDIRWRCFPRETRSAQNRTKVSGGKNLSLVSSSEESASLGLNMSKNEEDSDDEVLKKSMPVLRIPVPSGGKPYSHSLSQLSSKKRRAEKPAPPPPPAFKAVTPQSGKPRSMLGIVAPSSKKKTYSKKSQLGTTYQSQIIDTNAIKIKIRKTNFEPQPGVSTMAPSKLTSTSKQAPTRRRRKKKAPTQVGSESSGEEYNPSHGDSAASISVAAFKARNLNPRSRKESTARSKEKKSIDKKVPEKKVLEKSETSKPSRVDQLSSAGPQSVWGSEIPITVLTHIFEYVIAAQGTLPTAIRLGRVCRLWYSVAYLPVLWRHVELAPHTRDSSKTDFKLTTLLENRLAMCHTLNLAYWKVSDIPCVVACLADYCPLLEELNLTGWAWLTAEHLLEMAQVLTKLRRLDLSVTSEMGGSGTCLSANCMAQFTEIIGQRLTHLSLANNMFTALQQTLTSIATNCPNLEVLDISGARATSHPAMIPLELLQNGCAKLRVFRAANAQVVLASATTQQKMESGGFPCLEELSIAAGAGGSGVGEYRLNDEALERIVRGATRLRLLDLRGLTHISDSGLVRVPAWDLQHLFLGSCKVTQQSSSCLELVCEKWSHSLLEVDLAWASATRPLDSAVEALAEKGADSKLRILNLCGSSVSLEPVKKLLLKCEHLESINLSSCRALPRGMKRLYTGKELRDLKNSLDPKRANAKKEEEAKPDAKSETDSVPERESENSQASSTQAVTPATTPAVTPAKTPASTGPADTASPQTQELRPPESSTPETPLNKSSDSLPAPKKETPVPESPRGSRDSVGSPSVSKLSASPRTPGMSWNFEHISPQRSADSSSAPVPEARRVRPNSLQSPLPKQEMQSSPEETTKNASLWNLDQFKATSTHKSEASPLGRFEGKGKQCSPITAADPRPSPEPAAKPEIKTPNHWNYGNYSPMARQDHNSPYSSHNSPYSAQPSPAQPSPAQPVRSPAQPVRSPAQPVRSPAQPVRSPYSTQPSPYSAHPSPYSHPAPSPAQPSPYSHRVPSPAQPSPDASHIVKLDHQKTGANWNVGGGYSPMPKPQYSPHPSTHTSPDPGLGLKPDLVRANPAKGGQFSPMSRGLSQERLHQSPYSPRPHIESLAGVYPNRKSPAVGNYSPMVRTETHIPSPDGAVPRASAAPPDVFPRTPPMQPDPSALTSAELTEAAMWLENLLPPASRRSGDAWASGGFGLGGADWSGAAQRDDWAALDVFAPAPPLNSFLDQNLAFDQHQFVDESFAESRAD